MRFPTAPLGHLLAPAVVALALGGCAGSTATGKAETPPIPEKSQAEKGQAEKGTEQAKQEPAKTEPKDLKAAAAKDLDRAIKAAQTNDLDGAISSAKAAIEKDPGLEKAYLLLGSTCAMKNDLACEKDAYERGTKALPNSAGLANDHGMVLLRAGDNANAIKELEKANELTGKKDPKYMADLAYGYTFVDRLDEADKLAAEARKLNPKSFDAASAHGEILLRKKDGKGAIEAFKAAEALSDDAEVKRQLERRVSIAYAIDGRYADAVAIHEKLIAAEPNDPMLHVLAAESLMKLKKPKDAMTHMQAAVKLAPEDTRFLSLLMQTQEQSGDKKGAAETKKKLQSLGVK